jgi:hypothetical protein
MTYIIQNRIIRICENKKDYGELPLQFLYLHVRRDYWPQMGHLDLIISLNISHTLCLITYKM